MNDPSPTVKRGSRLPLVGAALVLAAILAGTAGALPGRNTVDRDDVQRSAITSKQASAAPIARARAATFGLCPGNSRSSLYSSRRSGITNWTL